MKPVSRFVKRAIWLTVTAVSIYLVMPSVVELFTSWPELERLRSGSLAIMTVLVLLSLACFTLLYGLCLRSTEWRLIATSQLASSAVARIVPGGAATATAVQYRMLNQAGISKGDAGTGITVATLLNFAVLFSLPVFAVPALLFGPSIDQVLVRAALVAVICFAGAAVIGGVFLLWDRPLRALGRVIDWIQTAITRSPPPESPREERFIKGRDLIRSHLAASWRWVVLASFGKWGFDYLSLVMAVRGVGHDDTSSVLLLAFVAAALLSRIPFTPGGLGFVEAGLTGVLVVAGLSSGDAVLATLAYRLVSYWMPIPLGGVAYGIYRYRLHRDGVEIERFSELGERGLEQPRAGPLATD